METASNISIDRFIIKLDFDRARTSLVHRSHPGGWCLGIRNETGAAPSSLLPVIPDVYFIDVINYLGTDTPDIQKTVKEKRPEPNISELNIVRSGEL